jgi:hypothetical protein
MELAVNGEDNAKIYVIDIKRVNKLHAPTGSKKGGAFFARGLRDVVENTCRKNVSFLSSRDVDEKYSSYTSLLAMLWKNKELSETPGSVPGVRKSGPRAGIRRPRSWIGEFRESSFVARQARFPMANSRFQVPNAGSQGQNL